jgi:energy-coupling factor transport system permease protein
LGREQEQDKWDIQGENMIRDITLGQYYPADSIVHKLDPRVKLFATFIYMIALFSFRGLLGFAIITAMLAFMIKSAKVPFRYIVKGLKSIVILLVITASVQVLFTANGTLYWHWGRLYVTSTGITNAILMTVRLIYLIIGTSLMTLTTTPNQLTDGLEKALGPLNHIRIPVHAIAMMMSIALRFIPILIEETDKIMKAQMARGADFESGNLIRKVKSMVPLLIPLFVSAFRRADDLAMAMEARCYSGGEGRTKMKPLRYGRDDRFAYVILILFLAAVIVARILLPYPQAS